MTEADPAAQVPESAEPTPVQVGPYRLVRRLGEGGMGVVHLAEQTEPLRRQVALKLIKLGMDTDEVLARFAAEQRVMAQLDHPGIARILDAGVGPEGRPYFAMEYVPGQSITTWCDERRLDLPARLELLGRVCRAVHHAHERGVVHRDLKPGNVLVREVDGKPEPKVIDFGIAKAAAGSADADRTQHTEVGRILGTPSYMSPEQAAPLGAAAGRIDARADVFSLGTIIYEVLVGSPPIDADTLKSKSFGEVQELIAGAITPLPSERLTRTTTDLDAVCERRDISPRSLRQQLRGGLDDVVAKATEKEPEARYQTAAELAEDLERCARGEQPLARASGASRLIGRRLRRHRRGVVRGLVSAAVALLIGALGLAWWDAANERDALLEELQQLERDSDTIAALGQLPRDGGALSVSMVRGVGAEVTVDMVPFPVDVDVDVRSAPQPAAQPTPSGAGEGSAVKGYRDPETAAATDTATDGSALDSSTPARPVSPSAAPAPGEVRERVTEGGVSGGSGAASGNEYLRMMQGEADAAGEQDEAGDAVELAEGALAGQPPVSSVFLLNDQASQRNVLRSLPKLARRAHLAERLRGANHVRTLNAHADHAAALLMADQPQAATQLFAEVVRRAELNDRLSSDVIVRFCNDHAIALRASGDAERAKRELDQLVIRLDSLQAAGRQVDAELRQAILRNRQAATRQR